MTTDLVLGLADFARAFGATPDQIPEKMREQIQRSDSYYQALAQSEPDQVVLSVLNRINSGNLSKVGEHRKEVWEKGWEENLNDFASPTMSKSAEISLMKTLALNHELVRDGLTFNSVAPGRVIFEGNEWDEFRKEDPQRFEQTLRQRLPLGRAGTPEEVAAVVVFVCSVRASLINGACIAVDGGESYSF